MGKLYAVMAEDDGQVLEVTDKLITVKYKDGTVFSAQIGTRYGRMEGSVFPHPLVTDLKVGQRFKKSDPIAYNQNFFEKDWLDPSRLLMKFGKNVTVALAMTNEVFEDSSAISQQLSEAMSTDVVKEVIHVLDFSKNIINLIPEGQAVEPNTPLFTVLDAGADYNNLSENTIAMLQSLAALSPRSKIRGTIERYEIKYNGELSDMSPSLRKLAIRLDKQLYDETKGTEYETSNNQVNSEYRSEGKNLTMDTLELKVFIRVKLKSSIGDKGVFAGQMKSVIGDVYTSTITTDSGTRVDAIFGLKSILNRTVLSPFLIGTTNRLLRHVSKQAADVYFQG